MKAGKTKVLYFPSLSDITWIVVGDSGSNLTLLHTCVVELRSILRENLTCNLALESSSFREALETR